MVSPFYSSGGMLIGPQIGKLLQPHGWYLPYLFATVLLFLNCCYVSFFLPDRKDEARDSPRKGTTFFSPN
jgi:hypothetical protein